MDATVKPHFRKVGGRWQVRFVMPDMLSPRRYLLSLLYDALFHLNGRPVGEPLWHAGTDHWTMT